MNTTAVSVEEYLNANYDPDRDYVEGRLEVRNEGDWNHADMQAALVEYLRKNGERFGVRTVPEIRVRITPDRYRVPDVCCVRRRPEGGIVTEPPVLCIEILSPDDSFASIQDRVIDYLRMGTPFVWVIDPADPDLAFIYEPDKAPRAISDHVLTAGEIRVPLDDLPRQRDFD